MSDWIEFLLLCAYINVYSVYLDLIKTIKSLGKVNKMHIISELGPVNIIIMSLSLKNFNIFINILIQLFG